MDNFRRPSSWVAAERHHAAQITGLRGKGLLPTGNVPGSGAVDVRYAVKDRGSCRVADPSTVPTLRPAAAGKRADALELPCQGQVAPFCSFQWCPTKRPDVPYTFTWQMILVRGVPRTSTCSGLHGSPRRRARGETSNGNNRLWSRRRVSGLRLVPCRSPSLGDSRAACGGSVVARWLRHFD